MAKGRGDGCLSVGPQAACKSTGSSQAPRGLEEAHYTGGEGRGNPLLYSLTGSDENLFPNTPTDTPRNHIRPAIWAPKVVKSVHQANHPALFHDHLPRAEAGELFLGVPVFFLLGLHSLVPRSPTIRQVTEFWPIESGQRGRHHLRTWALKWPPPPRSPTESGQHRGGWGGPTRQPRSWARRAFGPTSHEDLNPGPLGGGSRCRRASARPAP